MGPALLTEFILLFSPAYKDSQTVYLVGECRETGRKNDVAFFFFFNLNLFSSAIIAASLSSTENDAHVSMKEYNLLCFPRPPLFYSLLSDSYSNTLKSLHYPQTHTHMHCHQISLHMSCSCPDLEQDEELLVFAYGRKLHLIR